MAVPPPVRPEIGLTPLPVVRRTTEPAPSATAAAGAGVVGLILVALTTLPPVAGVPPTVTVAPAAKPVPLIAIAVPPAVGPELGLTPVTVGAGVAGQFANLNVPIRVCQFQVPFAVRYSVVYQKVQSSVGSTDIEL